MKYIFTGSYLDVRNIYADGVIGFLGMISVRDEGCAFGRHVHR